MDFGTIWKREIKSNKDVDVKDNGLDKTGKKKNEWTIAARREWKNASAGFHNKEEDQLGHVMKYIFVTIFVKVKLQERESKPIRDNVTRMISIKKWMSTPMHKRIQTYLIIFKY